MMSHPDGNGDTTDDYHDVDFYNHCKIDYSYNDIIMIIMMMIIIDHDTNLLWNIIVDETSPLALTL